MDSSVESANQDFFLWPFERRLFITFPKYQHQGETADAPTVHKKNQYDVGQSAQSRSDAHGDADGTGGGDHFKLNDRKIYTLNVADQHSAQDHIGEIYDHDHRSLLDQIFSQPFPKYRAVGVSAGHGNHGDKYNCQGCGLYAPGCRSGTSSDHHKGIGEQDGRRGHLAVVNGIEARRAHGSRGKKRFDDPFWNAVALHGIAGFKEKIARCSQDQENSCGDQNQFGVERIFGKMKLVFQHIFPYQKADASYYDQQGESHTHQPVVLIGGKRRIAFVFSHQVKAGITEGGHRVEYGVVQSLSPAHLWDEPDGEKKSPDTF